MENLKYLKYDAEVFTPPFRLGRKQQRAVLDSLGKEVVVFPPNSAIQASLYVNYLNRETIKMKRNSIKERAKKVPNWIKFKVSIRLIFNKIKHYIINI